MQTSTNKPDLGGLGFPSSINSTLVSRTLNQTFEYLDIFLYGFIDLPESGVDCSTRNLNYCVKCEVRGGYVTGENIDEFGWGHIFCRIVWVLALLVGFFGAVANVIVIVIICRRNSSRSFDFSLCLLAWVDLFCCLAVFGAATAPISYFENWHGRRVETMYFTYISTNTLLLFRSMSLLVTLLITVERYLVIAFPIASKFWFTKTKTRLHAFVTILISIVISIPRFTNLYIDQNIYGSEGLDIPSLRNLRYIYYPSKLYHLWEVNLRGAHNQVEYWIPIPLLILFNYLSYRKIKVLCAKRKQMNRSQRQELQATGMFLPVVVLQLCCNLWPTIAFVIMYFWKIFHREMWMIWSLTITINSAVNFWIYYSRAKSFKLEAQNLLSKVIKTKMYNFSSTSSPSQNMDCGPCSSVVLKSGAMDTVTSKSSATLPQVKDTVNNDYTPKQICSGPLSQRTMSVGRHHSVSDKRICPVKPPRLTKTC